jgi:hypothetical protein
MSVLFKDWKDKCVQLFLDDLLIYSRSVNDHLEHLEMVFGRLRAVNLKLKPKKCNLFRMSVQYLCFVISGDGVQPDPSKISAIVEWPVPKNTTDVRAYLGFCSYYRKFIRNFAKIARPLHVLTSKNVKFEWNDECQESFEDLKKLLSVTPILEFPRYDSPFIVSPSNPRPSSPGSWHLPRRSAGRLPEHKWRGSR